MSVLWVFPSFANGNELSCFMQIVVVGYRSDSEELLYVNKVLLLRVINLYTWFF